MDTFAKGVYVAEIKTQCRFALNAIVGLNNALQQLHEHARQNPASRSAMQAEVFRQTHSFLTHASNVSRLFWPLAPQRKQNESPAAFEERIGRLDRIQRGQSLRELYELPVDYCLKDRTLRDHLEHYDERLDDWRINSVTRNIASDTIGPADAIVGFAPTDAMRWFDPTTNTFRFRGGKFDLQELATATDQLLTQSQRLEEDLWRLQRTEHAPAQES